MNCKFISPSSKLFKTIVDIDSGSEVIERLSKGL